MSTIKNFTDFDAWNKSMNLSVEIFKLSKAFPLEERFGVTSQLRRAAVLMAANIAEGFGRYTYPDKLHKYVQARGELVEIMTELHYCQRVGYLSQKKNDLLQRDCEDIHKMLNALVATMNGMIGTSRGPRSEVFIP